MSNHNHGCPEPLDNSSFLWITSKQRNQNLIEKTQVSVTNTATFQRSHVCCLTQYLEWYTENRLSRLVQGPSLLHYLWRVLPYCMAACYQRLNTGTYITSTLNVFFFNRGPNKYECKKDIKKRLKRNWCYSDRWQRKSKWWGKVKPILPTLSLRNSISVAFEYYFWVATSTSMSSLLICLQHSHGEWWQNQMEDASKVSSHLVHLFSYCTQKII